MTIYSKNLKNELPPSMTMQDKQCALVLDEMAIKSGLSYDATCDGVEGTEDYGNLGQTKYMANHALAIIVRGLSQKWKPCIGYFLSSGTISGDKLKDITFNAIRKLSDIGLNVHVLVCDQGANNRNFLSTILNISVDKPYFECSDRKIFVIYDPPHLLKNIQNPKWLEWYFPVVKVTIFIETVWYNRYFGSIVDADGLWPLLLTWINFNPSMDK